MIGYTSIRRQTYNDYRQMSAVTAQHTFRLHIDNTAIQVWYGRPCFRTTENRREYDMFPLLGIWKRNRRMCYQCLLDCRIIATSNSLPIFLSRVNFCSLVCISVTLEVPLWAAVKQSKDLSDMVYSLTESCADWKPSRRPLGFSGMAVGVVLRAIGRHT